MSTFQQQLLSCTIYQRAHVHDSCKDIPLRNFIAVPMVLRLSCTRRPELIIYPEIPRRCGGIHILLHI